MMGGSNCLGGVQGGGCSGVFREGKSGVGYWSEKRVRVQGSSSVMERRGKYPRVVGG